jgi:hypothetical protein
MDKFLDSQKCSYLESLDTKHLESGVFMKNCLAKLLILLFISLGLNGFADCSCSDAETQFTACPKTYVSPEQIDIREKGIFVQIHNFILQTEYLRSDKHGIFFENVTADGCGPSQWRCVWEMYPGFPCNTCNWDWNYTCYVCNHDKKKKS